MRCCAALIAVCVLACSTSVRAAAQCGPGVEGQIAGVRSSWVKNWNEKQLDNVVRLYATHAALLPADGTRASGQYEIRASLGKEIGSKVVAHSVGIVCSGGLAYDSGTYEQDSDGKHVEGNYLVVLVGANGNWLIMQHASTAKP